MRGNGHDPRGYVRVHLGKGHPYANSGGWQWRHRLVAMQELGRRLLSCEHAHHLESARGEDGMKRDEPDNLEVLLAEYHGSLHGYYTLVAGRVGRGPDGRFVELDAPKGPYPAPRFGPIIGSQALSAQASHELRARRRKRRAARNGETP